LAPRGLRKKLRSLLKEEKMKSSHADTSRAKNVVSALALGAAFLTAALPAQAQHFVEEVFGSWSKDGAKTAGRLIDGFGKGVEREVGGRLRDAGIWRGGWEVQPAAGNGVASHSSYQPHVGQPPVVYGNFCQTQFAGRMPGPFMPVGSVCHFYTPYGAVVGWVTQ
jgi:hypothetical protein